MKGVVIYFGVLFAFIACVHGNKNVHYDISKAPELYVKYKKDYNKGYADDLSLLIHYEAFKHSLEIINTANILNEAATYDLNNFTDWTVEEIKHILLGDLSDKKVTNLQ